MEKLHLFHFKEKKLRDIIRILGMSTELVFLLLAQMAAV